AGLFFGGEQLLADRGRLARAVGALSPVVFPMGQHFSAWVYPVAGIDYLWDQPDGGIGASLGLGGEFVFKLKGESQITLSLDRYYSTIAGTRNHCGWAYRWGAKRGGPPHHEPNYRLKPAARGRSEADALRRSRAAAYPGR